MNGYLVTFYVQQNHRHHGKPLADWLMQLPRELELPGATQMPATAGIGRHHHLHSSRFFELTDQTLLIDMAVTQEQCARLFAHLEAECAKLFYVRTAVEFGVLGEMAS